MTTAIFVLLWLSYYVFVYAYVSDILFSLRTNLLYGNKRNEPYFRGDCAKILGAWIAKNCWVQEPTSTSVMEFW